MRNFVSIAVESALMLALASTCMPSHAQSELVADLRKSPDGTFTPITATTQEVNLVLRVTGHRDHFVPDLTPADISILDNDQPPERITHFECETNVSLRIALVIDLSDSTTFARALEQRAAANFVKNNLRSRDSALIIGFNEQVQIPQSPTGDYQLLRRAITQLRTGGQTAIYDAVASAARELGNISDAEPSRRVIILITDGEDNSSRTSLQAAAQITEQNETEIYVVKVGDFLPSEIQDSLKQLSTLTGGKLLGTLDENGIPFSRIEKDLRNQYVIGYVPANTVPDGTFHSISVQASKKVKVYYRHGYFAR